MSPVPPPLKPHAPPPSLPQKRNNPRVAMQAAIDFGTDSNFFSGFSDNISDGGIFIATVNLMPLGTEVDLKFTLPGTGQVEAHGVVRWIREVNDKDHEQLPGVGVQFTKMSETSLKAIRQFVSTREPLFFPD